MRDAQPFDSEFMLVSGDPKYVGICSSLAERIKQLSLQRTGDETDGKRPVQALRLFDVHFFWFGRSSTDCGLLI